MYLQFILEALFIACTAVVYSCVLTQPGEIFSEWYKMLDIYFQTDERTTRGLGPHPLFKLLVYCEKCIAGQMALWIFLIEHFSFYRLGLWTVVVQHVLFIGFTIFLSVVVKWIYNKIA